MSITPPAHKRILLKLSGEALMGDDAFGINRATIAMADITRAVRPCLSIASASANAFITVASMPM